MAIILFLINSFTIKWLFSVIEADAIMHLHDAIVVLVSLSSRLIGSESTSRNTFGWVRVEPMGELVAAVFVLSLSCGLLPHVMRMVVEGNRVQHLSIMFYVLIASLAVRLTGE